ncbi:unnamed protein product, partial [Ixodes pacificus]
AKDEDVEHVVDVDLLEDGQHGHGVHGRDDGAEEERVQQGHVGAVQPAQAHAPQTEANGERVPDGAQHSVRQDGAQVVEEGPVGHVVAGVQHNGRQHEQEEHVRRQWPHRGQPRVEEQQADDHADHDQDATLGADEMQLGCHVEA